MPHWTPKMESQNMSKTTSYTMYPQSVIGFGFAIDGCKLFAHLEAKAFKTKLCVHTSCGVALPDTQSVSSEPGKLERLFIKCCSLLWTDRACLQMLLHASLIRLQKQHLLACKLGIHVASHPPENCHLTGGKKVAASWPRNKPSKFWGPKNGVRLSA